MICSFCPRKCFAERDKIGGGYCKMPFSPVIARAALHFWEEPCISGKKGSGAVFFSGCQLNCVYCQNAEISKLHKGVEVTTERLCDIFLELEQKGAHNINLVTPTHYIIPIISALEMAKSKGLNIPVVYNCGGYEDVDSLRLIDGLIDVYMPDFKYYSNGISQKYSNAPNYRDISLDALSYMYCTRKKPQFDGDGIMTRGVLVRHMLLPSHLFDSKRVIKLLNDNFNNDIIYSIMNQYTPMPDCSKYPELNRTVTDREYDSLTEYALQLGIKNAYIQEDSASGECFIPPFDGEGVTI